MNYFEFPAHVRTAAQQYLLYFAQFLADIGISANVELVERAHRVMFTVKPEDGESSLELIHEALGIYLDLPATPAPSAAGSQNAAVFQLQSQIAHLQGQIYTNLAVINAHRAEVAAKDMMLRYQAAEMEQLRLGAFASPMPQPLSATAERSSNSLAPVQPVQIDWTRLAARLRRRFE